MSALAPGSLAIISAHMAEIKLEIGYLKLYNLRMGCGE